MDSNVKYLIEENNNDIDFIFLVKTLTKNIKFFSITFITLFAICLIFIFSTREDEYAASFPVSINNIASQFVVNDLKNVSKFSDNELIASIKCTKEEIEQLNFIQISNISIEEDKHKATININSSHPKNMKSIADKILAWTSNNSQIELLVKNKKNSINSLIKKTDQQLIEIETIKSKVINSKNLSESKFSFIEEYEILEKKYSLIEELENLNQITVYSSQIYIPHQARNKSKVIPLFFSVFLSLIIAILSTLIIRPKKA